MGVLTPFFNLFKPAKTDPSAIGVINDDLDIIDTEMHRPPLTVNNIEPDENRNIDIVTVPLADNLTTDQAQVNTGTFVIRTSGGEASIADGSATISSIKGNMVKTGYVPEEINVTVTPASQSSLLSATVDRDTFISVVTSSQTLTFTYSSSWSPDISTYGITVSGTPAAGDQIVVAYTKENRGTIATATPTSFLSTGWNLYNHAVGYARVVNYSQEYGYMIAGTYTDLEFSETLTGTRFSITPVGGIFFVPADGYVFVTGGNATDTAIWTTWADWTEEPETFEPYSSTSVDLSGVMVNFPDGLMKVGNICDEINFNTQRAYSRIEKIQYSEEALEEVIESGVDYDTDTGYIYAVRLSTVSYPISLAGNYSVSDHGTEMFMGTSVPVELTALYGQDLKGKLVRDVVTLSQQTLTDAQKLQVRENIGELKANITSKVSIGTVTGGTIPEYRFYKSGSMIHAVIAFQFTSAVAAGTYITIPLVFSDSSLAPIDRTEGGGANNENLLLVDILPASGDKPDRITFYVAKNRTSGQSYWITIMYMCKG